MRLPILLLLGACARCEAPPGESGTPPDTADTAFGEPLVEAVTLERHREIATILELSWTQLVPVDEAWVVFGVPGEAPLQSPTRARAVGRKREALLGLPADREVEVRIVARVDGIERVGDPLVARTGPLPEGLLAPVLVHADPALQDPARFFLGSVDAGGWYRGPSQVLILDRQGRVVWYHEVPGKRLCLFAQPATDGTHIVLEGTTNYLYGTELEPIVERLTLDLRSYETLELPALGFTFDEIEGGALLYGSVAGGHQLVRREPDGSERAIWDCDRWIAPLGAGAQTCSPNSVVWNPTQGTAFWSMYLNDTVVEIDLQDGAVLRQFGQLPGGWGFDPAGSTNDYQHYPGYTPDGHILASTHGLDDPGVQFAREWRVDDAARTLVEVWSYGDEVVPYATYGGEAWRMPGGNTFVTYGTGGSLREVTPDRRTAWELAWPADPQTHLLGHFSAFEDLYALNEGPGGTP